ncbi:hypothetical protein K7H91_15685 [Martelella mediterranea]|nr:hypothetical protein [Martelella mediterranea]
MTNPTIRILIVDDEVSIRKMLRVGLSAEGYKVVEAMNARGRWRASRQTSPT